MLRLCCTFPEIGVIQKVLYITKASISNESLPIITVPQSMIKNLQKLKMKKGYVEKQLEVEKRKSGKVLIACKRPEFNSYRGDKFKDTDVANLASHGWKHYKSAGDYFSIIPYSKNHALINEVKVGEKGKFSALPLNKRLIEGLSKQGFDTMTYVQFESIRKILKGEQVMISAETGSGKTLAYLVPVLERIQQLSEKFDRKGVINSPVALVLLPSRELADQVGNVLESLKEYTGLKHCVESSKSISGRKKINNEEDMDILVGTPGMIARKLHHQEIHSNFLQHIVLDEADTLLDDSFSHLVNQILNKLKVSHGEIVEDNKLGLVQSGVQFIVVSATLPRNLQSTIKDYLPVDDMEKVTTPNLHKIMPHIQQKFIRLKSADKLEELILLLKKKKKPSMIFCNKGDTAYWLNKALKEQNINNLLLSGGVSDRERYGQFELFQNGKEDILVCTDIASRGLDTSRVEHVINYDFPCFMSDYIHRAGRVGRVGSFQPGFITSFVTHKWDVDLLWKIETAVRKQSELHNVNANIKRKLESVAEKRLDEYSQH